MIFRLAALVTLGMVLCFPAWKGVWTGYVAIAMGASLYVCFTRTIPRWTPSLLRLQEGFYIAILIVLPTVIQLSLIFAFRSKPSLDGLFVYREALTLLETGRMNPLTYYPPAQIWYYALFFKLFGASPLVAQLCQIPLMAMVPMLVYLIGRDTCSLAAARWAGIGTAFYPGLLFYVLTTPYYFSLYAVCMLLMVWSWLRMQTKAHFWIPALAGGVAAGCGALAKAVLLIAPAQTLLFMILTAGTLRRWRLWLAWGAFVFAMMATISPWVLRNQRVFGNPIPVATSGPLVFYSANNPVSNGLYCSLPDEKSVTTPAEMLAHGKYCRQQAWEFIRGHPRNFARLIWLKWLHTWGTETTFVELININGQPLGKWHQALRATMLTGWATLAIAWGVTAIMSICRRLPPTPLETAVGIIVLSKFVIYALYEGGARHHLPGVPLLILLVFFMPNLLHHRQAGASS